MGVDYSTTIGYGIAVEELPDSITNGESWWEEEANEWLWANDFKYIEFERCGDWMNGDYVYLFSVKGTSNRVDAKFGEGVVSFDDPEISHEAGIELMYLCGLLEIPWPDSVAWKLIFNVS